MTLFDCRYLGLVAPGPDDISDGLPEKCAGERRRVRDRSVRGIGLVLSDDAKGLLPSIIANDRHGTSELNIGNIGIGGDELRAGASGIPVTKIARGLRQRIAVARRLGFAMAPPCHLQRRLDQFQSTLGDIIRMLGKGAIRQVLDEMVFVYKGSAHGRNMGVISAF